MTTTKKSLIGNGRAVSYLAAAFALASVMACTPQDPKPGGILDDKGPISISCNAGHGTQVEYDGERYPESFYGDVGPFGKEPFTTLYVPRSELFTHLARNLKILNPAGGLPGAPYGGFIGNILVSVDETPVDATGKVKFSVPTDDLSALLDAQFGNGECDIDLTP